MQYNSPYCLEIVGTTCSVFVINRKISQNAQEIKIRQNNCGNGLPDNLKILLQIAIPGHKNVQMPLKNKKLLIVKFKINCKHARNTKISQVHDSFTA